MKIFKAFRFLLFPLYLISFFLKRDKNIWVFGAHQNRFCENTKALYNYISNNSKVIKAIWITGNKKLSIELKSKGFLSYTRWSLEGIYYSLKGKYYFYNVYSDDINFYTSGNAILVNLWHGIPLKQIEFDIKKGPLKKQFNSKVSFIFMFLKPYIFKNPNYVITTHKNLSDIFSSAFRISSENCLDLGYPRTDCFFESKNLTTKEKIILYMPTWRSKNKYFINKAFTDLNSLNNILKLKYIKLIIKLHPNDNILLKNYSNIEILDSKIDIYEFLPKSDYLITDYSSVYFDYLLLNKEILFYPFDIKSYIDNDRDLYFEYDKVTPGKKIYNFEELLYTLKNIETLNYQNNRFELKKRYHKYEDSYSSKRIYDYFKGLNN